ncbi:MAG TPA: molybdate ABC transporter permease subunit [Myxococcales bacterium]|nr:molybdate ABC transporter permease subunit [Myxococcales bacterium]HAN31692.1 molybdate ABC transporter permease subunit [Myxococcales bacterium]
MKRQIPMGWLALPMILTLSLPLVALGWTSSWDSLWAGWQSESFASAMTLSLRTSMLSLGIIIGLGTPAALWLNNMPEKWQPLCWALVRSPLVLPPAVTGLALLMAFGSQGPFAALHLPFAQGAVVLAQVIIGAPLFIEATAAGLRQVNPELTEMARCLGHSPAHVLWRVTLPIATPSLLAGASLAWARALGEFGATLLFAGNLPGVTQTMPLAIYEALQGDLSTAVSLAVSLAFVAVLCLALTHRLLRRHVRSLQ